MKKLTPRQKQVLDLVCEGLTVEEISDRIGLAYGTVRVHLGCLFKIFGAKNRVKLAIEAIRCGNFDLTAQVTSTIKKVKF